MKAANKSLLRCDGTRHLQAGALRLLPMSGVDSSAMIRFLRKFNDR